MPSYAKFAGGLHVSFGLAPRRAIRTCCRAVLPVVVPHQASRNKQPGLEEPRERLLGADVQIHLSGRHTYQACESSLIEGSKKRSMLGGGGCGVLAARAHVTSMSTSRAGRIFARAICGRLSEKNPLTSDTFGCPTRRQIEPRSLASSYVPAASAAENAPAFQ